jgi:large subunit ribosomal protein L6
MTKSIKKYNIKIPKDITAIYCKKKRTLTFLGPIETKSKKLKTQIFINHDKKSISVSPILFSHSSNTEKKKTRMIQNTTVSQIKYMLIESSILLYKKLKINGVGYRTNFTEHFNQKLLTFKLGYSHFIYLQTLNNLTINCLTKTKLCISGSSHETVSHLSAIIRNNKIPEQYKGKGVLYENEVVEIKEGKKV